MPPKSVVTHVSSTVRRPGISAARVRDLVEATLGAERIRNAMISVTFVGSTTIARMNAEYLRHKGATDVISFGMGRDAPGMPAVGDIYICTDVAKQNAKRNGIALSKELARLVVHGTLHVAGYEHPDDESRTQSDMWKRQERILARRD
ncbi:MAG TPA: rRNA maturation RNase YbeY [Gemmatimonadaceae bacterium]|nr:rRNA maturation RNase YbeY [Gemmatimonadaceae bacterium]